MGTKKRPNIRCLISLVLLFFVALQQQDAQNINLKFENLSTSEGLSSSTCTEIFQDSDGFLWFGTIDGLNRYNGYEFKIYRSRLNDDTSISNNRVNAIAEDRHSNLWIGTNNGLNVFNRDSDDFIRINLGKESDDSGSLLKVINDVSYDTKNNALWVGTNNGAIRIDLEKSAADLSELHIAHFLNDPLNERSLDNNTVNSFLIDQNDHTWLITDGEFLNRYDKAINSFERVYIEYENSYELNHLPKKVFEDSDGDFWIGNDLSNMILWSRWSDSFSHVKLSDISIPIRNLHQDNNQMIWVSSDGHGLFLIDKEGRKVAHQITNNIFDASSLPNNKPSAVFEDENGILWVGSYDKGVSKLDPSKYSFGHYYYQPDNPNGLNEKIVQSVLEDSQERIWISAYNGGLNLFNEEDKSYRHYEPKVGNSNSLSSSKILYTFESSDGKIWVCTLDGGLNSFDPERNLFKRYEYDPNIPNSIGQNSVWAGVEDDKKRLWLGLRTEGLSLFDPIKQRFHNYKNKTIDEAGLTSNSIVCLFIDSKNRLLIGTTLGLDMVDLDDMEDYIPEDIDFTGVSDIGLQGNRINYITEDYKGNIWLGTDNGIVKLSSEFELLQWYSSQNGLPNNLVVGIKEDDNRNFWITTKSGLSFLNPETHKFKNFNTQDGLQGPEFQTQSIEKTSDGRIVVGGINGFNIFHPDDILIESSDDLKPQLTSLKINNQNLFQGDLLNGRVLIPEDLESVDKLRLKYDENYISFDFVALHFENPEQIQYAYRMAGLDDEFVEVGATRTANYSSLPPGSYAFEVKASLEGNWEDAEQTSVAITILPPPWRTWWAYLIYALLVAGVFWFGLKYYTNKVREEKEHELDQMKLQFIVNVSHEFRTPLTLILNPIDKIIASSSDGSAVKSSALTVQRSARRLLHLVNQLLDYRKMDVGMAPLQFEKANMVKFCRDIFSLFEGLAKQKEISYQFFSDSDEIIMNFDFDKVEKIITNLISNAIKFTESHGEVVVRMSRVAKKEKVYEVLGLSKEKMGDHVEIVIEDTGLGLTKEQLKDVFSRFSNIDTTKSGTGIGLNLAKTMVEKHGGEIYVDSEPGKGSQFVVRMPLNLEHQPKVVENIKNEFRLNSIKAVEYDMMITDNHSVPVPVLNPVNRDGLQTLLIVEDNKELRTHLANDLKNTYNVREAANGEAGLALAKKYYPDIVVSDVMMPKMDGFEMCRNIKSDFDISHIPVLLLTAKSHDEDRVAGYVSGADAYLAKPFVTKVLKARISNLLDSRERLRQKFSEVGGMLPASELTTNNIDKAFLDKATKIVLDNIDNKDFKQEHLLKEIGIGRSQLYRKINSLTGHNPSHFIRTVRLRYAAELLQQKKYSIKEVSYMTGFNSTAYFSKTFRELFEVTPTEFMSQKKKEEEVA